MGFDFDRLDAWGDAASKTDEGKPSVSEGGNASEPEVLVVVEAADEEVPATPEPEQP